MSSTRADVRAATASIIDGLIENIDNVLLIQQFATIILNGGKKVQASMLEKLTCKTCYKLSMSVSNISFSDGSFCIPEEATTGYKACSASFFDVVR